jgi:hypothetical protein
MRRNVLETIQGIEIFPLISLVIFFGFFTLMLYWVFFLDKSYVDDAEHMPLDEESTTPEMLNTVSKEKGN